MIRTAVEIVVTWGIHAGLPEGLRPQRSTMAPLEPKGTSRMKGSAGGEGGVALGSLDPSSVRLEVGEEESRRMLEITAVTCAKWAMSREQSRVRDILFVNHMADILAGLLELALSSPPPDLTLGATQKPGPILSPGDLTREMQRARQTPLIEDPEDVFFSLCRWLSSTHPHFLVESLLSLISPRGPSVAPIPPRLKKTIGALLSRRLLTSETGLRVTLETFFRDIDADNAAAMEQIVKTVLSPPSSAPSLEDYYIFLAPQIRGLLPGARDLKANDKTRSLTNVVIAITFEMFRRHTDLANRFILIPATQPLLTWSSDRPLLCALLCPHLF